MGVSQMFSYRMLTNPIVQAGPSTTEVDNETDNAKAPLLNASQ